MAATGTARTASPWRAKCSRLCVPNADATGREWRSTPSPKSSAGCGSDGPTIDEAARLIDAPVVAVLGVGVGQDELLVRLATQHAQDDAEYAGGAVGRPLRKQHEAGQRDPVLRPGVAQQTVPAHRSHAEGHRADQAVAQEGAERELRSGRHRSEVVSAFDQGAGGGVGDDPDANVAGRRLERRGRTCTAIVPRVAGRAAPCTNAARRRFLAPREHFLLRDAHRPSPRSRSRPRRASRSAQRASMACASGASTVSTMTSAASAAAPREQAGARVPTGPRRAPPSVVEDAPLPHADQSAPSPGVRPHGRPRLRAQLCTACHGVGL